MFYDNTIINSIILFIVYSIPFYYILLPFKCICPSFLEYSRFDLCAICWHCFQFPPKICSLFLALANNCIKLSTQTSWQATFNIYILYIYIVYLCMHKQIAVLTAAPENMQQILAAT